MSDAAACTAVLMTVPYEVAKRLEVFLNANGVPCRIRKSDVTPEALAEEALRSAAPEASEALRGPIGRVLKAKLKRDVAADIKVQASGMLSAYDVLVRPDDLPSELARVDAGPRADAGGTVATAGAPAAAAPSGAATTPAGTLVTVGELTWNAAWELVASLEVAGIPAAVLEPSATTAHLPMERRTVPVAVRPEDADRARALIAG
jgi:hypothetical protein